MYKRTFLKRMNEIRVKERKIGQETKERKEENGKKGMK